MNTESSRIEIDIVSDLHVDQWDPRIGSKYPCGEIRDRPYDFRDKKSRMLIVAGDVSDDINTTLEYLHSISGEYDKILFVDGNHEHVDAYPGLHDHHEINKKTELMNNPKLVYLPSNPYRIMKTVFIGSCGWWDYCDSCPEAIKKSMNYFEVWIPHFGDKEHREFIDNVTERSRQEYERISDLVDKYSEDPETDNIIIVTHTVPDPEFAVDDDGPHQLYNTRLGRLTKMGKKISHWVFGHTHSHHERKMNNIHFICNPRGRPEDFNRFHYSLKTIVL